VSPRAGLDDMEKREFLSRDSNSDPSLVQPVVGRYKDYAIAAPEWNLYTDKKQIIKAEEDLRRDRQH
jgi:hypothetical protein